MQNDIDNFILVANVFRWLRHELVNNLAEKVNISAGIVSYARYKFRHRRLVLMKSQNHFMGIVWIAPLKRPPTQSQAFVDHDSRSVAKLRVRSVDDASNDSMTRTN